MISIQTNVNSLVAQQNLSVNTMFQSKTIQQLTSGYRINQAGDDAAGLAVANKFRSTVAELTQGVANGNDATAQLQIMDGGMSNISQILDRLKTLATQSASGAFTGSRATLNSEFQNDITEIDRQAQSIGLDSGGTFAKNLSIYLGQGSGSSSLANAAVSVDLTNATVDSQSLGMKGMQAVGGTADIGGTSATSVANILADSTNKASTATPGSTDFLFSGAGFSDANKVKVSVNLAGVTDTASLVTAFNKAIAASGNGTTQAGSAFAKANIVASVNSTSGANGSTTQQLSFTSSTSAFQVEAGDQMANALVGNFNAGVGNTTGKDIKATATGATTALVATAFTPASTILTVRIQGAGLSGPVDLQLSNAAGHNATVGDAITDLTNQISSNTDLQKAGISLSVVNGALQFTSSRGESINVLATGDSTNQLGLGSFVTNSSAGSKVDYKSIIGGSYNYGTAANDQASLQFSVNGAAATAVNIDLEAGDAVASARKTSVISNPTIAAATASKTVGVSALATHDWSVGSGTPASFTVAVNGGSAQTVNLTTNFTLGVNNAALLTEINGQLTGATATINGTNHLTIKANTAGTGVGSNIAIGGTVANIGATFTQTAATDGNDKLTFSVDGVSVTATLSGAGENAAATGTPIIGGGGLAVTQATASSTAGVTALATHDWSAAPATFTVNVNATGAQTINLTTNFTLGVNNAALLTEINNQLNGATATIDGSNHLVVTSDTTGTTGSVVFGGTVANIGATFTQTPATNGNNKIMVSVDGGASKEIDMLNGGANTTFAQDGDNLASFQSALDTAFGANAVTVSIDAGHHFTLTSNTVGSTSAVTVSDVPAGLDANNSGFSATFGGSTVTAHGATTSAASLATTIQSAIDTATGTGGTNAHATVTVNNDNSLSISNDHKGVAHTISAFTGTAAVGGSQIASTGVTGAVAGANRSGTDMQNYLNQVFSSNSTLQPAQLKATWIPGSGTAGTLQVASGNDTNFRVNSGSTGSGVVSGSVNLTAGHDWSGGAQSFRLRVDGALSGDITLNTDTTGGTDAKTLTAVQAALTAAAVTGVTASMDSSHHLVFTSNTNGASSNVQVEGPAIGTSALTTLGLGTLQKTADADLGFGVSGASFTADLSSGVTPKNHMIDAGGASSAFTTVGANTNALSFTALKFGNDAQAITISANGDSGAQSTTITLKNIDTGTNNPLENRAGRDVDSAIAYINTQLQQSNNATLQKIVAVKETGSGGLDQINFVSSLSAFNVSAASTANGDGLNAGASTNVNVGVVGVGSNLSIETQDGAKAAVTALATAVGKLGAAQAAIGRSENQLTYAISLASSQITNFSAAESQIRDTNVAQQAANLSKAQVLSQAAIAAMAQANSAPQAVLSLLRG